MILKIQIVVLVVIIHNINAENYSPIYKWKCMPTEKCVRQKQNENTNVSIDKLYDNQDICQLLCDRNGAIWPLPTGSLTLGNDLIKIAPNKIQFNYNDVPSSVNVFLEIIVQIFKNNLHKECDGSCNDLDCDNLIVNFYVTSSNISLAWTTDESYALDVSKLGNSSNVYLTAKTVFGIRHGLETLSQLMAASNKHLYLRSTVSIRDSPMFVHRGLLLDTARNYIPIDAIERTIDGMAASKLNVFHWHITDSQSFPMHIPRVPQLTRYGAYSSKEIYSQEMVSHIIEYGRYRGVRVMLELDMPSHSGNGWQWGQKYDLGDLAVCVNQQPWRNYCIQPPCGQLNPVNPNLHLVLRDVFKDLVDILPMDETLHMGGDEVFFGCWNATVEILDYMLARGMGRGTDDFLRLWAEFHSSALNLWDEVKSKNGKNQIQNNKLILWSSHLTSPDVIDKYLPNNRYIIQTWVPSSDELPSKLLQKGYQIIMSTKNAWYFDHGFWGVTQYYQWKTVYNNRILRHKQVLGGEACVWTELIDENSLDTRTWPRAAALAERLWSDLDINVRLVETRFYRHRKRLQTRGLKPDAVAPEYCVQNQGECA